MINYNINEINEELSEITISFTTAKELVNYIEKKGFRSFFLWNIEGCKKTVVASFNSNNGKWYIHHNNNPIDLSAVVSALIDTYETVHICCKELSENIRVLIED